MSLGLVNGQRPAVEAAQRALGCEKPLNAEDRTYDRTISAGGRRGEAVSERVTRESPPARIGPSKRPKRSQTAQLIDIASTEAMMFATPGDETAYAVITMPSHREVWPVRSRGFKRWLVHRYYTTSGKAPNTDAINQALATTEAGACYSSGKAHVFLRRAEFGGKLYLDLCDSRWRAIEVSAEGWNIVDNPPVYFTRAPGMLPLCEPSAGGGIEELRPLLNVVSDSDFHLIAAWLLGALRPKGPYPVLALTGEGGTAKTSTARLLRSLIDPHLAAVRRPPQSERDFFIGASKTSVLVYDNLSSIPEWLSDALCVAATGGSYTARQLHTDSEEVILSICLPVMLTSVGGVIARSDLASRAITVELAAIPHHARISEAELSRLTDRARPRILGSLLTAISHGLSQRSEQKITALPRLADFMHWVRACEGALWREALIEAAFEKNSADAADGVLEGDAVALAVMAFLSASGGFWKGKAQALLSSLPAWAPEAASRDKSWPRDAARLSSRLTLASPVLRQKGISIIRRKSNGERMIEITSQAG